MKHYLKKWYFVAICFILAMLACCLSGCGEPKQNTEPGDFGHLIYKQVPNNCIEWKVEGMYLCDSLVVFGGPPFYRDYEYPIVNINTGNTCGSWVIKSNK